MELFQLRYFVAAARVGNFSRAAEQVHISQPSLSQQIANLEKELGVDLFARQGRSVVLTDAGEMLLQYAEQILQREAEAHRAVREFVGLERGRLRLCALPTAAMHLLPAHLVAFRNQHPGVEITVHETVPARAVAERVACGDADLGFLHLPCSVQGLQRRDLLTEELVLVVPARHPLVGTTPALGELADEDFVWAPEGTTTEHPFYAACLSAGFRPKIACVSGSGQGMQALVATGLGIALLPRLALNPPEGAVVVELAPPRPKRTIAVVWQEGALSHAARAFLAQL